MGLLYDVASLKVHLKYVYKLDVSIEFLTCADNKLTSWFYSRTGIKASKLVSIGTTVAYKIKEDGTIETDENIIREKYYYRNEISGMPFSLHINRAQNLVLMVWWSKSGRIYEITDTDIDCDDIEFELEPFDPQLYFTQLNYREPHPFKTEGLSFELEVISFDVHSTLELDIYEGKENLIPPFIDKVYKYIETYNSKSVVQDRKYGVVHNSRITQNGNKLEMYIDFGSTGFRFCNQLLKMISKTNYFSKVVIS